MVMSKLTFATAFVAMIAGANAGAGTGFCNGKSMGIYRVPGEPECTQKYFQCVGSDDATPGVRTRVIESYMAWGAGLEVGGSGWWVMWTTWNLWPGLFLEAYSPRGNVER